MKTKSKTKGYIVHGIAAAVLALTAQISLAGSATWLLSPQNSAWENVNNWTPGGPPNGPSDIATFAQSSQTGVNISTPEEVNSIVFTSGSASYDFSVLGPGELIISGTGVTNNNSVLQTFEARTGGQIIFSNTATAASAHMSIVNSGQNPVESSHGSTIFNDASSAAGASISNQGSYGLPLGGQHGQTIFNGTSTAGHAAITNGGGRNYLGSGGSTIFNDSSTADTATLVADEGGYYAGGGAIVFNDAATAGNAIIIANGTSGGPGGKILFNGASTGGTARVEVFDYGSLNIIGHQSGLTMGSIEGSGYVLLGANNLTVGTNDIDTAFSGTIYNFGQGSSLAKIGSGVLTLQANDCIEDTVGLILVSGSIVKLDFTGPPDVIASLKVNGVPQPPGIYGGPMSGAPNILPEFEGSGTVSVGSPNPFDFNGDGHPDWVLQNASTHQTAIWYLNNNVLIGSAYGPTLATGWELRSVADFNRDARPDYALFNPVTRQTAIWYMNNNALIGGAYGPTLPSGFSLVATGDFDNNSTPDYVLYNAATRQTAVWYMYNNVFAAGVFGPTLPAGWSLAGVADFDHDGHTDYALFNSGTGQTAVWYLSGGTFLRGAYGPTVPGGWTFVGTADFNGDGKPDYALFNHTTRQTAIWHMDNNVFLSGDYGPTLPAGWSLAAP